ncbi:hypothetical protein LTR70_010083 [Exophiala xenobiotica]|uniref:Glucose-methanol-choline oxidoreductase N-terminal domain-containing protein n=1 Tax=Lithohypha guttulata TaxID=1690604 RepID=A0ABR0JVT9_9EURO|nr:hypothetical protein LTR24_010041 [Lithohypha guttulata]KAK5309673.1 hypothetical protein LTR70_010083 [Exophiala xenobiotica]
MPETYTHVVVGAGTAGSIVASRISENPSFNVLLIEAGPDYHPPSQSNSRLRAALQDARRVPMKGQTDQYIPEIDWNVQVQVPNSALMTVPQAKVVGGGSSINGGTALRNTSADSEEWAALGNPAWSFEEVLPVYRSLEDDRDGDAGSGIRGMHILTRAKVSELGRIQQAFVEGASKCGFDFVNNLNATSTEGVGCSPCCRKGNVRVSLANTFIDPVRNRRNISIMANRIVDRITFDGSRATGIELVGGHRIYASEEVIVCAGAIFSPAILQRSGVGSPKELARLGIDCIADLPVGANASDHPCIPLMARPRLGAYSAKDYSLQCNARWSSQLRPGIVDLQLVCFSYLFTEAQSAAETQRSLAGNVTGHVAGIGCNVNKPDSLGFVMIQSANAMEQPVVSPNYLQSSNDKALAREVVRRGYEVMTSPDMQSILECPIRIDEEAIASNDRLDQYIQAHLTSTYHFCGTCRMASRAKGGVVDQSGRVYETPLRGDYQSYAVAGKALYDGSGIAIVGLVYGREAMPSVHWKMRLAQNFHPSYLSRAGRSLFSAQ